MRLFPLAVAIGLLLGCSNADKDPTTTDGDADTDADTDSDTDSDADADGVYINELLASNDTVLDDEDGDFDDWLELYNGGTEAVDVSGWGITDGDDAYSGGGAYLLPAGTTIPAQGYLLIWCDDDGAGLHADFKLSADGEWVSLVDDQDVVVDEVEFPAQTTDISWGRDGDGAAVWISQDPPTPGAAN